jgi:hypothetical protein
MNWRDGNHGDYASCDLRVIAPSNPVWRLRLSMTAHVRRLPRKCSFMLIYGERIFALDVNPARSHNNLSGECIRVTHWTRWPCDVVEPDERDLQHTRWFGEFLERTNISFLGKYERPPYMPEQTELWDV